MFDLRRQNKEPRLKKKGLSTLDDTIQTHFVFVEEAWGGFVHGFLNLPNSFFY